MTRAYPGHAPPHPMPAPAPQPPLLLSRVDYACAVQAPRRRTSPTRIALATLASALLCAALAALCHRAGWLPW